MSNTRPTPARKPRKRLAPSEKYEIFVQGLTQQATQREAAEKFGVERPPAANVPRARGESVCWRGRRGGLHQGRRRRGR